MMVYLSGRAVHMRLGVFETEYKIDILVYDQRGKPFYYISCAGLMLPVLEDPVLAKRAGEGRYGVQDLLLYSSVCGTGLDVVPHTFPDHHAFAPADVAVDAPLVQTLRGAWQRTHGTDARVEAVTYGADMRHFVLVGGTPCVMFGAGDVRLAHAPNESIPLDDLLTAVTTTAVFIADWCGFR